MSSISMEMLTLQMRVQLKDKQTATTREGVVADVFTIQAGKVIDGRPVVRRLTKRAEICCYEGGADPVVVLTPENFDRYEITIID